MKYQQFVNNTKRTWSLVDGAGGHRLEPPASARQLPGEPMSLLLDPAKLAYADAYWWLTLGPVEPQVVMYNICPKFPTTQDIAKCQAFEWETDIIINGRHYDTGMQADFADTGNWRVWQVQPKRWVDTGIKLPSREVWLYGIDLMAVATIAQPNFFGLGSGTRFDGISVNGSWIPIGLMVGSEKVDKPNHFNMAVQLDGNKAGEAYSCQVAIADVRVI